jgi:hypothetical protein
MKQHSISLVIKEMQLQTTLRFLLSLVRMAIIYIKKYTTFRKNVGEKKTYSKLMGWYLGQSLWKSVWRLLTKFKIELSYD